MIVVFDLMGTLLHDPFEIAYAQAAGCTFEEFQSVRPLEVYHRFERGEISEDEYWHSLRVRGIDLDVRKFHLLRRGGYRWLDGMRSLLRDCAKAHRTVIGSNYPVWIADVAHLFSDTPPLDVFASCDMAVRKPDPQFFRLIARMTGQSPRSLVLIDDKRENVEALRAMGGLGIHHTSPVRTRQVLAAHAVLEHH
jgi:HAD superfamily hydrolase (TIGR01509 family)